MPMGPVPRSPEYASVMLFADGRTFVQWPDGFHRPRPPWFRKPYAVVDGALGEHRTDFRMSLPALGGRTYFTAQVQVAWTVVAFVRFNYAPRPIQPHGQ